MQSMHPKSMCRAVSGAVLAAAGAVTSAVALSAIPLAAHGQSADVPAGYRLVWADEFDTDGLPDPRRWVHDTAMNKQGWHNKELQYYSAPRAENAVVRSGRLSITARRESMTSLTDWGGQRYTSSRLLTRGLADWTYGFFEVRARLPCGKGTWPAIWMLASKGGWPEDGELDIMEQVGSDPTRVSSAIHMAAAHSGGPVSGASRVTDPCRLFHNYQMHWTAEGVRFAVDGFTHLYYPNLKLGPRAWPFDAPQFMILNIAIGGYHGGEVDDRIFPVSMEVDYVRVYQAAK